MFVEHAVVDIEDHLKIQNYRHGEPKAQSLCSFQLYFRCFCLAKLAQFSTKVFFVVELKEGDLLLIN
jgi:hypothetical protein